MARPVDENVDHTHHMGKLVQVCWPGAGGCGGGVVIPMEGETRTRNESRESEVHSPLFGAISGVRMEWDGTDAECYFGFFP